MTSYNMAVCIGQCLLWSPSSGQQPRDPMSAMKVISVVQQLIDNAEEIFGDKYRHIYPTLTSVDDSTHLEGGNSDEVTAVVPEHLGEEGLKSTSDSSARGPVNCCENTVMDKTVIDIEDSVDVESIETSTESPNAFTSDKNVDLRSPHGGSHGADSGFVDDDLSAGETPGSLTNSPLVLAGVHSARNSVEQGSCELTQCEQDTWSKSLSDKRHQFPLNNGKSVSETADHDCKSSTNDNFSNIKRKNRTGVDMQCHNCGMLTFRGLVPKARKRLSLPTFIRVCRCQSGMTANGSDLFPTRIMGDKNLLPTVFEDDMLIKTEKGSRQTDIHIDRCHSAVQRSSSCGLNVDSLAPQRVDCATVQNSSLYSVLGEQMYVRDGASSCSVQQTSKRNRCLPSYAEAILHKALHSAAMSDFEKHEVDIENSNKKSLDNDQAFVLSSSASNCADVLRFDNKLMSFFDSLISVDDNAVARPPPPAYHVATRRKYETNPATMVDECASVADTVSAVDLQSDGLSENVTASSLSELIVRASAQINAVSTNAVEQHGIANKNTKMQNNELSKDVDSSRRQPALSSAFLIRKMPVMSERPCNLEPSSPVNNDIPCQLGSSRSTTKALGLTALSAGSRSHMSDVASRSVVKQSSQSVSANKTSSDTRKLFGPLETITNRRQRRAAKRRSVHSYSDTQIETVFGKSKQVNVCRSFSDSATVRARARFNTDNKENVVTDLELPTICKRLKCPEMETGRVSRRHSTLAATTKCRPSQRSDSNNNRTDRTLLTPSSVTGQSIRSDMSKRQVLKVKNRDWYRNMVKQYSDDSGEVKEHVDCSLLPPTRSSQPMSTMVTLHDDSQRINRLGSADQRQKFTTVQRSWTSDCQPSRDAVKNLAKDKSGHQERITVTWSVSKLREKYCCNENNRH